MAVHSRRGGRTASVDDQRLIFDPGSFGVAVTVLRSSCCTACAHTVHAPLTYMCMHMCMYAIRLRTHAQQQQQHAGGVLAFYRALLANPQTMNTLYTCMSETLRYTWRFHPEPWRIVEDVTRWPTTIDLIIQLKGGVVPDALIQHAGCSRTKRKGNGDARSIRPNPEISAVARKRQKALRAEAKEMARA